MSWEHIQNRNRFQESKTIMVPTISCWYVMAAKGWQNKDE